jgi:hypothetical protein
MTKTIVLIAALLFLLQYDSLGQYPFEKYKSPMKKTYSEWKRIDIVCWTTELESLLANRTYSVSSLIYLPGVFANRDSCKVQVSCASWDTSHTHTDCTDIRATIQIFRNSRLVQKFSPDSIFYNGVNFQDAYVADLNGDHLPDIKLLGSTSGVGLGVENVRVIYLIQKPGGHFVKLSYDDMEENAEGRDERDMDQDGEFIAIDKELVIPNNHSYWVFNLFKFQGDSIISANKSHDYPLVVRYLNRSNYRRDNSFPDSLRQKYSEALPRFYLRDDGKVFGH